MAATIVASDLISETRISEGPKGYELTRVFEITGLTGSGADRLKDALGATGLPVRGDASAITGLTALKVIERTVEPSAGTGARVVCVYRKPTPEEQADPSSDDAATVKTISASLSSVKTNLDYNDALITVTHNGITQGTEVDKQLPTVVFKYRRRETQRPFTRAVDYVGKVNLSSFEGKATRTVLCTSINGDSDDGGVTYLVDYEFQFLAETWDALVYWIDPDTNRPPSDLVVNVGYKRVQIYDTIDFDNLDLT